MGLLKGHFSLCIFMKIRGGDNYILESLLPRNNNYVVLRVHNFIQTRITWENCHSAWLNHTATVTYHLLNVKNSRNFLCFLVEHENNFLPIDFFFYLRVHYIDHKHNSQWGEDGHIPLKEGTFSPSILQFSLIVLLIYKANVNAYTLCVPMRGIEAEFYCSALHAFIVNLQRLCTQPDQIMTRERNSSTLDSDVSVLLNKQIWLSKSTVWIQTTGR